MTDQAIRDSGPVARTRLLPIAFVLIAGVGCQSVDLGEPAMAEQKNLPPSCAVTPTDYKMLAYLRDNRDAAKTTKMLGVLKAKYSGAPPVNGDNPVVAAQTYVVAKSDIPPVQLESIVSQACAGK